MTTNTEGMSESRLTKNSNMQKGETSKSSVSQTSNDEEERIVLGNEILNGAHSFDKSNNALDEEVIFFEEEHSGKKGIIQLLYKLLEQLLLIHRAAHRKIVKNS